MKKKPKKKRPTLMKVHNLDCCGQTLALGGKTVIMGILNVTPDSFSDGGRFFDHGQALAQARKMAAEGADIIDIGGESTRPFSDPVPEKDELDRVIPLVKALAGNIGVPISIDTTKAEVARQAVAAGAQIINDVSALHFDPEMGKVAAETGAAVVLMHMKGTPKSMQENPVYDDLIGEIHDFLSDAMDRARAAGIENHRLVIDPGIGFGKTVSHNLEVIQRLDAFLDLGAPILLGVSRKAFIRKVLAEDAPCEPAPDHPDIETGTQAAVALGVAKGAHIVRVHNVARTRPTVRVADAVGRYADFRREMEIR